MFTSRYAGGGSVGRMRIPLAILAGLAGYFVWSSALAGMTGQIVSALSL